MKILFLYNNDCAVELGESIKAMGHEVVPFKERLTPEFALSGKFDLAVSYTYRYILTDELIDALGGNVVNIHNAYLPYNRGADPNLWSIVEGTPRGVTLHYISAGLDKGDIIAQRLVTEGDGDTLKSSYDNLDRNAKEMFMEALAQYDKWDELRHPQEGKGTYHSLKDGERIKSVITSYDMKIKDFLDALRVKLVFVSNYINHHQIPFCEELYRLAGGDFVFVETEKMAAERLAMGWDGNASELKYVIKRYEDPDTADKLIFDADCVIFGGAEDEELIIPRLEAGKFTLRYSERIYKSGRWKFVSPKGLKKKYHDHIRFKKKPVYLLCAGAYVAGDFKLIGAYPGKKFKFGYFPEVIEYGNVHFKRSDNEKGLNILWAARFIDWKHPETMVFLAKELIGAGIDFKITMIGDGNELEKTKALSNELKVSDKMKFPGSLTPDKVRDMMLSCDIFTVTSDRLEGWGAVVNEAMNSGAVVIAPRQIGAAPYLIKDGENGFMYDKKTSYDDPAAVKQISDIIKKLAVDREWRFEIGGNAYKTVRDTWNAKVAAERLWDFINDPAKKVPDYGDGPLSRA